MINPSYLIIVEIGRRGFILERTHCFENAEKVMEETITLTEKYQFSEMDLVAQELNYFASYNIKGDELILPKFKRGASNGYFSVWVVEVDMNNFNLALFISERENQSAILKYEDLENAPEDFLELFPRMMTLAN